MSDSRVVYPQAQVAELVSDEASNRYLCRKGLPAQNVLFLPERSPGLIEVGQPPKPYVTIGRVMGGAIIGLDPATGEVVAIYDRAFGQAWHANADLEKFVSSI